MLEGDKCCGKKGKAEQSQGDWERRARVGIISRVVREASSIGNLPDEGSGGGDHENEHQAYPSSEMRKVRLREVGECVRVCPAITWWNQGAPRVSAFPTTNQISDHAGAGLKAGMTPDSWVGA